MGNKPLEVVAFALLLLLIIAKVLMGIEVLLASLDESTKLAISVALGQETKGSLCSTFGDGISTATAPNNTATPKK